MKTNVISIEEDFHPASLPNGTYNGTWGGYEVTVKIDGVIYRMKTEYGIRTPCASCVVVVENGVITVSVL